MKTRSVALVARILVKTQPFRTTGEKGSMKTQSVALVARTLVKTQPIRTTGEKALWKHGALWALCISSKNHCKNIAYSHDRRKGTVKTRGIAYAARIHVKTQPCHKPGKRRWKSTALSATIVHCWEVLWDPRSMSMSKRSPSVIEPLDDMWWCNKKQKFNNELDVYSMYVIIPFFLHKMLASPRQPTFRDCRWTKYSNLEERIGRHPLPQMSKLKNVCALCHAVGFDLFCPPVSTLGRRKQLWNLGGAGDKVVQGLNNLSIYCM